MNNTISLTEKVYLQSLRDTCEHHGANPMSVLLKEQAEGAFSIMGGNGNYNVTFRERGYDLPKGSFDNLKDACIDVIKSIPLPECDNEKAVLDFLDIFASKAGGYMFILPEKRSVL